MTITQYLGLGTVSRGRMAILANMNTRVATAPYLHDAHDKEAVIEGINNVREFFSTIQNLTWVSPTANQNTTTFVNSVSPSSFLLPPHGRLLDYTSFFVHADVAARSQQRPALEAQTTGSDPA